MRIGDWAEQRQRNMPGIGKDCRLLIKQLPSSCHCVPFFEASPVGCF